MPFLAVREILEVVMVEEGKVKFDPFRALFLVALIDMPVAYLEESASGHSESFVSPHRKRTGERRMPGLTDGVPGVYGPKAAAAWRGHCIMLRVSFPF